MIEYQDIKQLREERVPLGLMFQRDGVDHGGVVTMAPGREDTMIPAQHSSLNNGSSTCHVLSHVTEALTVFFTF